MNEVKLTSLPKNMQGPALFLTLDHTASKVVQMDVNVICSDRCVEIIIFQLNKFYVIDEIAISFRIYRIFESYQRTESSS